MSADVDEIIRKITPTQIAALKLLSEKGTISPNDENLRRPIRCLTASGLARREWAKGRMWAVISVKGLAVLAAIREGGA